MLQADTGEETTRSTLTGPGRIIGSPRYMSPEQADGQAVDAPSDVFSFGLVMFEALTGRLPFAGRSRKDYLKNLAADEAETLPASVPARVSAVTGTELLIPKGITLILSAGTLNSASSCCFMRSV